MSTVKTSSISVGCMDTNKNLSERELYWIERMAQAVKKCVDSNQYLDEWEIGRATFEEFRGELELLDKLI